MNPIKGFIWLSLGLIVLILGACQSTGKGGGKNRGETRVELGRQLDAADRQYNSRAYDLALKNYKAVFLAANSRDLSALATEAAAMVAATLATLESGAAASSGDEVHAADGDQWMARAEKTADELEPEAWTRVLLARGIRALEGGDTVKAQSEFASLYSYCFTNDLTPRAIQAATLAARASDGDEQLEWMRRAIQAAATTGRAEWEAPLWTEYAWLLDTRGKHEDALDAFERARSLAARAEVSRVGRVRTDWEYGHGLRMVGRLDEANELLAETSAKAHAIYLDDRSPRSAEFYGRVVQELGEIAVSRNQFSRARERFTRARELMVEAGALHAAPEVIEALDRKLDALPSE